MNVSFAVMANKLTVQQLEKAMIEAGVDIARLRKDLGIYKEKYGNWKTRDVPSTQWAPIADYAGISIDQLLGKKPILPGNVTRLDTGRKGIDQAVLAAVIEAAETVLKESKIPATSSQKAAFFRLVAEEFWDRKTPPTVEECRARIAVILPLFTGRG